MQEILCFQTLHLEYVQLGQKPEWKEMNQPKKKNQTD